jgi:hypothetical protein
VSVVLLRLPKRFLQAALVYTLCLALAGALIGFVARETHGEAGARASVFAALVCWAAGVASLGAVAAFARTPQQVVGLLASVVIRTGLPLAGLAALKWMPELEQARGGLILVITYLFSLVLDVLLTVGLIYEPGMLKAGSAASREVG